MQIHLSLVMYDSDGATIIGFVKTAVETGIHGWIVRASDDEKLYVVYTPHTAYILYTQCEAYMKHANTESAWFIASLIRLPQSTV